MTNRLTPPRLANWSAHRPWRALGLWFLFVVACLAGGMATGTIMDSNDGGSGDSGTAERVIDRADFPVDPQTEQVLIRKRDGSALSLHDARRARTAVAHELASAPNAGPLSSVRLSPDHRAALATFTIKGDADTAVDRVKPMLAAVANAGRASPDLRIEEVGGAAIDKALDDQLGNDFQKAELLSLPLTLLILIAVFGALVAAGIPLMLALTSIIASFGLASLASHVFPQTENLQSILLIVGMAVGVDYALFMLRRARDERGRGASVRESVLIASATSGRAVVVSGLTVAVAMAGMLLAGDSTFTSLGIASMLVVATAVLGALVALPALLVLIGDRVDRVRIPFLHRLQRSEGSRFWGAVVPRVLARPRLAFGLAAGVLVVLALPALGMNTRLTSETDLPRSIPIMRSYDALTASFPAQGDTHELVIKAADVRTPQVQGALARLEHTLRADPDFALDRKLDTEISRDHTVETVQLAYPGASDGAAATHGLATLRDTLIPETLGTVAEAHVTGNAAGSHDFNALVHARLPIVVLFVLALTLLLMLASFRSLRVALTTIGLNLLSVAAAWGLLVLVFQHHWLDSLLGIRTNGAIVAWLPLFLFVILFGLSMDYHVFVLSRIREAHRAGASARDAIAIGVERTAGVVTSAAVVMVGAFGIFATLSLIEMKQLGVGLATAVLLDATIVRGVLLPAALQLLGEKAWHEARWLRRMPAIGHGPAPAPARAHASLEQASR
jgi:putative drug exporter of the RND superfamily